MARTRRGFEDEPALPYRPRRQFDAVDLSLGIVLAVAVPLLVYVFLLASGKARTKSDRGRFREKVEVSIEPDAELLALKMEYFSKLYQETGKELLRRAQETSGLESMNQRDWAKQCLSWLEGELTTLENELNAKGSLRARFAGELTRIALLKTQVQDDLRTAGQMN